MDANNNLKLFEQDKQAREYISTDIGTNYFVEAGAGSGKTTALVSRMVALVRSGKKVENICAITFTKAAANEFHDRFRRKLSECARSSDLTEEERRRCSDALRNIDLCFTGTIDSFCGMILNEHPLEAGVLPESTVCTNRQMQKLYTAEYHRAAKGEYGEILQQKYYRFCSVHSNPYKVFCDFIGDFMDARNAVLRFESPEEKAFDEESENKKTFVEMLQYIYEHPEIQKDGSGKAGEKRRNAVASIPEHLDILRGRWQDNMNTVLSFLNSAKRIQLIKNPDDHFMYRFGEYVTAKTGDSGRINYYTIDQTSEKSPATMFRELQHAITLDFMDHFVRQTADTLKNSGSLSYFDCLLYLRDMLKADAENGGLLARHISERHRYYLIDEFQDTNPLQAEIFFYLTATEPRSDWRECVPRRGSLFIVGDPKQSIYRFRNADVASYLRIREMFKGEVGRTINLTRNFRSAKELCAWFDASFSRLMNTDSETQCRYNPIPVDDSEPECVGSLHGVYCYNSGDIADPDHLVSMIKWIVGSDSHTVRDRSGEVRRVRFGDIMVITPNTTHLGAYIVSFKEGGVSAFVEGKIMFDSCGVLCAAAEVLNAAAFPGDTVRVYKALKGRAFGISDDALRSWGALNRRCTVFSASEDEHFVCEPVNKALLALRDIAYASRNMTSSVALTYIVDELRLFEKCGSDNLEYLHYALELLRAAELEGSIPSLQDGAAMADSLLSGKLDGEKVDRCMSLVRNDDRVHIANMHKVKGLEAPIVILADPSPRNNKAEKRIDHSGQEPVCYRFCVAEQDEVYTSTVGFAEEKEAELQAGEEEKTRLRYVSATRARDMLIIGEKSGSSIWNELIDPDMHLMEFDALTEASVQADGVGRTVSAEEIYSHAEAHGVFTDRTAEDKSYVILHPSQIKLRQRTGSLDEPQEREEKEYHENTRSVNSRMNAALIGSMVHRLMEALVSSRGRIDVDMLVEAIRQEFYYLMAGNDGDLAAILRQVAAKITSGGFPQSNGVPDDILAELSDAESVQCEVPFSLRTEKDGNTAISSGVMDLVYRKGGKWHIIDYKTSEAHGDLDERYAAQLEAYRDAFLVLTGEHADARVYHIDA